jgi:hypothetical protein
MPATERTASHKFHFEIPLQNSRSSIREPGTHGREQQRRRSRFIHKLEIVDGEQS